MVGRVANRVWPYLGAVCIVALLLVVIVWLPRIIAQHDIGHHAFRALTGDKRGSAVNSVRTTLLQALAGLVLIIGAVFTFRQLRITKEGQVTDRYTKAVDQLGRKDSLDVRIGGIYALERIAKDSEPDRATIADVLAAFVREHAPFPAGFLETAERDRPQPSQTLGPSSEPEQRMRERAADVQTALTVLGRLPRPDRHVIDLSLADLRLGDLRGADLHGANLDDTHLEKTYLHGAILEGARLHGACLINAHLIDARLEGADLRAASLNLAHLGGADLTSADLKGALIAGAFYNKKTRWPDGFDPNTRKLVSEPDDA